jgi:hypothetical protein
MQEKDKQSSLRIRRGGRDKGQTVRSPTEVYNCSFIPLGFINIYFINRLNPTVYSNMTHREFILTVKKEIKAQQGKKTWTFKKPGQMMIFDQANFERLHSGENFNHEVSNNESISQLEAFVRYNKSDFEKEVQVREIRTREYKVKLAGRLDYKL